MKKSVAIIAGLLIATASLAQKKVPSLGVSFALVDYKTPQDIDATSLELVLKGKDFYKASRMSPFLAASYLQGISKTVDLAATLSGGWISHPANADVKNPNNSERFMLELAGMMHLKPWSDKYWVVPYLAAGIGGTKWGGYYSAFAPVGVGLQVKVSNGTFVTLNSQYRFQVTQKAEDHLYHSLGVVSNIKSLDEVPVVVPAPALPVVQAPKDTDGDGVADADDKCPTVAGLASLQGCADGDSDGIADGDDKCPAQAGLAKYQGCPIPDTDADGVNDEEDKCVNQKGVARYQGCPIPDTDGDGINDEEDKCVDRKGTAANGGCPEIAKAVVDKIAYAAKNVFFATGSAKLLPKSYKGLNEVVKLLKEDESLLLDVSGHTDNTGKEEKNQVLSENRALAVKNYLVSKGIAESRLVSAGYGSSKPVADNKTAAGKAKNRRTELGVRNF
jgi:OmpA-OmpF porin, OOP family